MNIPDTSDFREFGLPIGLPRAVRVNSGRVVAAGAIRPEITSKGIEERFVEMVGSAAENFPFSTCIFAFDLRPSDDVLVRAACSGLPLVIRRGDDVVVNFDVRETQVFRFSDSGRPFYTYVPGFNVHMLPEVIRRPLSNLVESLRAPAQGAVPNRYGQLPLTGFDLTVLLLNAILTGGSLRDSPAFHWPGGKRAVFVPLHDVDTDGFLQRAERDALFRIEQKHQIHSTWFIPTKILNRKKYDVDYLLHAGNEVGWHGHKHDHRDHLKPFADQAVKALASSRLRDPENFPTGMRLPKLLKSNYLFELLERSCPALCYDTSFQQGIVPYYLWLNGRESTILEIPVTVPTDVTVYNQLRGLPRARRADGILKAQIARTERLIGAGALVSIVTHPEKTLSERPDFLAIYDQYLSYIRSCPDIWITTAGEVYKYWTQNTSQRGKASMPPVNYAPGPHGKASAA
jgi:peptidoglycan/xylan/chitin deacetylase (PgdA/CDA1 family)